MDIYIYIYVHIYIHVLDDSTANQHQQCWKMYGECKQIFGEHFSLDGLVICTSLAGFVDPTQLPHKTFVYVSLVKPGIAPIGQKSEVMKIMVLWLKLPSAQSKTHSIGRKPSRAPQKPKQADAVPIAECAWQRAEAKAGARRDRQEQRTAV